MTNTAWGLFCMLESMNYNITICSWDPWITVFLEKLIIRTTESFWLWQLSHRTYYTDRDVLKGYHSGTPLLYKHEGWLILIHVPCIFYYFVLWPTNAQLIHKLSHSYMFQHYHVILRAFVINTWPSYTSTSKLPEEDTIVSKHVGVW
jgi:hypothetical protein